MKHIENEGHELKHSSFDVLFMVPNTNTPVCPSSLMSHDVLIYLS